MTSTIETGVSVTDFLALAEDYDFAAGKMYRLGDCELVIGQATRFGATEFALKAPLGSREKEVVLGIEVAADGAVTSTLTVAISDREVERREFDGRGGLRNYRMDHVGTANAARLASIGLTEASRDEGLATALATHVFRPEEVMRFLCDLAYEIRMR